VAIASEAVTVPAALPLVPGASRFHDIWPLGGLVLAVFVNVAWIGFLGYGLFELVGLAL